MKSCAVAASISDNTDGEAAANFRSFGYFRIILVKFKVLPYIGVTFSAILGYLITGLNPACLAIPSIL